MNTRLQKIIIIFYVMAFKRNSLEKFCFFFLLAFSTFLKKKCCLYLFILCSLFSYTLAKILKSNNRFHLLIYAEKKKTLSCFQLISFMLLICFSSTLFFSPLTGGFISKFARCCE